MAAKTITAKKRCCRSDPRCKKCPVVLRRLERVDLAQRIEGRTYVLARDVKKRHIKAARVD